MSDKARTLLLPFDQQLRTEFPVGMDEGIHLRIEKVVGFEKFNTRPYHNFETWSDGYSITGPISGAWTPYRALRDAVVALVSDVVAETVAIEGTGEDPVALVERLTKEGTWHGDSARVRQVLNAASGLFAPTLHVEAEDLDDAMTKWLNHRRKAREILAEDPPKENQRTRLAVLGYHYAPEE